MSTPQRPTCTGLRIRAPADALVVFHAVALGILPLVERRLAVDERRFIHSGCVFVWQERIQSAEGPAVRAACACACSCWADLWCALTRWASSDGQTGGAGARRESAM